MAIAGRVAIVPKGDWSADATYKRLDAVTYNNTLYFAKKEVPAGTATSNTEYWSKSIVGGASAIATTEDAGVVKPDGKSMSVDESGTLRINLDGTTITLDEAKNVIKLADALKEKIGSALQPESIVNNQVTTEEGFALDARQANPNINGTLAKQLNDLMDKVSTSQGQNLINYPYDGTEGDTNGITWTVNEDGSITANGTASKETPYSLIYPYSLSTLKSLQLGYTYTISDGLTDEQHANIAYTQVVRYDKSYPTYYKYGISSMKGTETYTANDENSLRYGIRLIIRNGATADNITFRPMFEIGTVSHEYQPTTLSNPTLKKRIDDIKDVKKVPTIGIENIFTGNPFAVIADSGGLATVGGTKWEQDNGGYHVEDIKYPAGGSVSLTVSMTLPANSIVLIDVNTLNYENIKLQGTCIKYNFTDSPKNDNISIQFAGRNSNTTLSTIRYMPLVIHLA